jgi:membrane protease YdiL (CAAX protease family)
MKDMRRSGWGGLHGLLFFALFMATPMIPSLRVWPLFWIVPLLAYATVIALTPTLRATFRPWSFGSLSARNLLATLIIAGVSCTALVIFHLLAKPDLQFYRGLLPAAVLRHILFAGFFFSVGNALLEELVFRGILFDALEAEWGKLVSVLGTSALFGYGHLHGYPPGPLGAVLAGIYALALGSLRIFTSGLGFPVIAHIAADATIFTLLVRSGAFQ